MDLVLIHSPAWLFVLFLAFGFGFGRLSFLDMFLAPCLAPSQEVAAGT